MGLSPQSEISSLRNTIEKSFATDIEFEAFCVDYFPDIKKRFGAAQEHLQKVNLLLETVDHDLIREAISTRCDNRGTCLSDGLNSQAQGTKKPRNNQLSLVFMISLLLIACASPGVFLLYKNLMAIRLTGDLEFTVGRASTLPAREVTVEPNDFAASIERMVIEKLGPENTLIRTHKEFDVQSRTWNRHMEVIEKKTNKTVLFATIPENRVQAWVGSLPLTQPFAREIIVEALRIADVADKRRLDEIALAEQLPASASSESVQRPKQRTRQKQFTQPTLPFGEEGAPPDRANLAPTTLADTSQSGGLALSAESRFASPQLVPESFLGKEFIDKPSAMLSGYSQMLSMCAKFTTSYKICVGKDGLVTNVTPIRTAAFLDGDIRGVLASWKLKPRSEPICFIKTTIYEVNRDSECKLVETELPEWKPELANIHERIIPLILAMKSKTSSNDDPTLPDDAKAGMRGYLISGSYKICVSLGGVVYKTEPIISINKIRGLPGIDEHIMAKFRSWTFRPWPVPTCFIHQITFEII